MSSPSGQSVSPYLRWQAWHVQRGQLLRSSHAPQPSRYRCSHEALTLDRAPFETAATTRQGAGGYVRSRHASRGRWPVVGALSLKALTHLPTQQLAATFHLKPDAQCRADPDCRRMFVKQPPELPAVPPELPAVQLDAVQAPQALTLEVPHLAGTSRGHNRT